MSRLLVFLLPRILPCHIPVLSAKLFQVCKIVSSVSLFKVGSILSRSPKQ